MKTTQAELLNQTFKEAHEHIITIYEEKPKSKNVAYLLACKLVDSFGIMEYNKATKRELNWWPQPNKEYATKLFKNLLTN